MKSSRNSFGMMFLSRFIILQSVVTRYLFVQKVVNCCYIDTNLMALSSNKIDSEFLYNIISKEGLYKIADTSTIPQINNKHIEPYEVLLPRLDEQRTIGKFFKDVDNLITLHQRKLEKLQNLKKAMLERMFI